jgi:hypothetical protein
MNRAGVRILSVAALLALAGCPVGTTHRSFRPAQSPAGVEARLDVEGRRDPVIGELLAVRDTGLVLLVQRRVTLVPYNVTRAAIFPQVGATSLDRKRPDPRIEERIRLVSRFPQGIGPDLERSLLAAYGQTSMDVLTQ